MAVFSGVKAYHRCMFLEVLFVEHSDDINYKYIQSGQTMNDIVMALLAAGTLCGS
jgi:hypothetical protein